MLPAERPMLPARMVAPATPAMAQEHHRAFDAHRSRTPHVAPVPAAVSNVQAPRSVDVKPLTPVALATVHDQTGNTAVAHAMSRAAPVVPVVVVPVARGNPSQPS